MRKNVTRKDFWMEIRKSPGRFLSILYIVMLGVAFFAGIRATGPSMRITGDAYFDNAKLMDIKALSIYGLTEEDITAKLEHGVLSLNIPKKAEKKLPEKKLIAIEG